jgi:hypothetical protein
MRVDDVLSSWLEVDELLDIADVSLDSRTVQEVFWICSYLFTRCRNLINQMMIYLINYILLPIASPLCIAVLFIVPYSSVITVV